MPLLVADDSAMLRVKLVKLLAEAGSVNVIQATGSKTEMLRSGRA